MPYTLTQGAPEQMELSLEAKSSTERVAPNTVHKIFTINTTPSTSREKTGIHVLKL